MLYLFKKTDCDNCGVRLKDDHKFLVSINGDPAVACVDCYNKLSRTSFAFGSVCAQKKRKYILKSMKPTKNG